MNKDRIEGSFEQAKGKAKEIAGKASGDSKLETEGKARFPADSTLRSAVGTPVRTNTIIRCGTTRPGNTIALFMTSRRSSKVTRRARSEGWSAPAGNAHAASVSRCRAPKTIAGPTALSPISAILK